MEDKGFVTESMAIGRPGNISVQITTTIKLTKENSLTYTVAVKMVIAGRGHVNYIDEKMKKLDEDSPSWK